MIVHDPLHLSCVERLRTLLGKTIPCKIGRLVVRFPGLLTRLHTAEPEDEARAQGGARQEVQSQSQSWLQHVQAYAEKRVQYNSTVADNARAT